MLLIFDGTAIMIQRICQGNLICPESKSHDFLAKEGHREGACQQLAVCSSFGFHYCETVVNNV